MHRERAHTCNNKETIQTYIFLLSCSKIYLDRGIKKILIYGVQSLASVADLFENWLQGIYSNMRLQICVGASTVCLF